MTDRYDQDWQAKEEARHDGAASLTAVRIWPSIAPLVVGPKERARARFIRIITAYKVLVWRESAVPTRTEVLEFRALKRHLRNNDIPAFQTSVAALAKTLAGKSALVRYNRTLSQRKEPLPAHWAVAGYLAANYDNPRLLKSAANEARDRLDTESRQKGRGHPRRAAARRFIGALRVWWDREIAHAHEPARLPDGSFNSDFIDFLCTINDGLHAEVQRMRVYLGRWLPPTLPLGPSDPSHGRRRIIALLSHCKSDHFLS
jgi:hypothetical protein